MPKQAIFILNSHAIIFFVPERYYPSHCLAEDQQQFVQHLRELRDVFVGSNLEYALVGGIPLKVFLDERVWAKRENGTSVDVDGLAFGPDKISYQQMMAALAELRAAKQSFPEVGLEPISFGEAPPKAKVTQVLSGMWKDPATGTYYLTYGKIKVPVRSETMETVEILVEGVPFPSFRRRTILERYRTRGGVLKPKDRGKVAALQLAIDKNPEGELPKSYYQEYRDFVSEIQKQYKLRLKLFELFWLLDQKTNGNISGAKGQVYAWIKHFTAE